MAGSDRRAIWVVLVCAALWGFWWLPVGLFERAGLTGPWIALAINLSAVPVAIAWVLFQPGGLSGRAAMGALLVGLAVTLYAMAASYTDFIRAVILFYLAPAWSTLIEIAFFGRRWRLSAVLALSLSLLGMGLLTRGEVSLDGLGAIGDWMALASGLCWSVGTALVFSSKRARASSVFALTILGGIGSAVAIAGLDGSLFDGLPEIAARPMVDAAAFAAVYMGLIFAGTMWGAFHLPPAVMSYLLSIEVLGGVLSSALILKERFGLLEAGGAICILAAVLVEVVGQPRLKKDNSVTART